MGPHFDLLANACQFALSRKNLPNFLCRLTTHRSLNGDPLDVVTAEVTFLGGVQDRNSNLAVDGRPISSWREVPRGWRSGELFGTQLTTIFRPQTGTSFKFKREVNGRSGSLQVFSFRFKSADNSTFYMAGEYPGLSGTIWIDGKSGQLQRVESSATELDANGPIGSYESSVNYGLVAIADLGNFLAPTGAVVEGRFRAGAQFKNVLAFHDCQRFASEVRILPNPEP